MIIFSQQNHELLQWVNYNIYYLPGATRGDNVVTPVEPNVVHFGPIGDSTNLDDPKLASVSQLKAGTYSGIILENNI